MTDQTAATPPESDSPSRISESIVIRVPPETAYAAVSDVARMGEWSPECRGAWIIGRNGPARTGMRFIGRNRARWLPWPTLCHVVEADPGRTFAFHVSFLGIAVAGWTYRFTPLPEGCEVHEEWRDRRSGPLGMALTAVTPLVTGVVRRRTRNRATMRTTLVALRDALESGR
ncbi:SRPBCC family protein [Streptomyces scopuliridis]|uniref:SRPBCC family protein n=1 Tax=Streptomyces scopuliridis TaxID=452529 RepID=A0ACD4ZXZ2_9ACTN|nr:SRPBCC family protein [Streptomyces scopuliridis]WSB37296.1 SRPBCC family protein [Streptomyces scopuliridis]WSC01912.1 SRPBCC family protein [Streptomyces scopuliridis]WSC04551.1 SRPBCC family protein [Streptomyces scopuliridis]